MRSLCLLILLTSSLYAGEMRSAKKAGESFGKQTNKTLTQQLTSGNTVNIEPNVNDQFDPNLAKGQLENGVIDTTETRLFLESSEVKQNLAQNKQLHAKESFLREAGSLAQPKNIPPVESEQHTNSTIQTCLEAGEPYPISYTRALAVTVVHTPEEKQVQQTCLGHAKIKSYYWKSDAEKWIHDQKKVLNKDPSVTWLHSQILKGGTFTDYEAQVSWSHCINASSCNHYNISEKVIKKESWKELGEEWVYDNPTALEQSRESNCRLVSSHCLDSHSPRTINGLAVERKCWKEQACFLCTHPQQPPCHFLQSSLCILQNRKCIKSSDFGCAVWKLSFKCTERKNKAVSSPTIESNIYCIDGKCHDTSYTPNGSFAEIATKLSIFQEMKNELEASGASDATHVKVFGGKCNTCYKNVLDNVVYDCCNAQSGLATKLGLTKCTAEEIELSEKRKKGLCHYIGFYPEKLLDILWKSRDAHVYCCFPSKLVRVLQEQARIQLGIKWGKPEKPMCRGLTSEEIARLDFAALDLSEVYEEYRNKIPIDLETKLQTFEGRLEDIKYKMDQHEEAL